MVNKANLKIIDSLKTELDKKAPFKTEDEKRLKKKFRLEFNYNSNHLEGNTLTYGQTQLLLFFDKSSGDVPVSDIEEMKAHDVALSYIEEMAKDNERPLTELFIKDLNKTILVKPFWKDAETYDGSPTRKRIEIGQYKTSPNSVRLKNGEIHEYASPEETPALMSDLLDWYNKNKELLHPVQLAAEFHYKFVCIHPFDDGNGRVARLIMNYILLKNNYPPVIIKSADKENYLTALQKADTGDIDALIEYVEKQAIWSLEISLKAAKGEDIDELGDIEKEIEILKREKLTKIKIFKTPKVIYELIIHINDDLWMQLNKVLGKFDDFFAETKFENYVDNLWVDENDTISGTIVPTKYFFEGSAEVNKHKILGHNLDEEIIHEIQWIKRMLSLKTATKKIDYDISCSINLSDTGYKLIIAESNSNGGQTVFFKTENEYKSLFMPDTVESIVKIVSKHMINEIKKGE